MDRIYQNIRKITTHYLTSVHRLVSVSSCLLVYSPTWWRTKAKLHRGRGASPPLHSWDKRKQPAKNKIDGSYLCLQSLDKFWICSARNDRNRKLWEYAETWKKSWNYFGWTCFRRILAYLVPVSPMRFQLSAKLSDQPSQFSVLFAST